MQVVALAHQRHEDSDKRNQDKDDPTTNRKLCKRDDDENETGDYCPNTIEQCLLLPVGAANISPVYDHACLADRESEEYANCIGGDQEGDECARCEKEDHSAHGNRQNSTSVRKPIAALSNLARQESVSGQNSCELRPTIKSGVGCKKQDASSCNLIDDIENPISE